MIWLAVYVVLILFGISLATAAVDRDPRYALRRHLIQFLIGAWIIAVGVVGCIAWWVYDLFIAV